MLNYTSQCSELTDEQFVEIVKLVVESANIKWLLTLMLSRLLFTPKFLFRTYRDNLSVELSSPSAIKAHLKFLKTTSDQNTFTSVRAWMP